MLQIVPQSPLATNRSKDSNKIVEIIFFNIKMNLYICNVCLPFSQGFLGISEALLLCFDLIL